MSVAQDLCCVEDASAVDGTALSRVQAKRERVKRETHDVGISRAMKVELTIATGIGGIEVDAVGALA